MSDKFIYTVQVDAQDGTKTQTYEGFRKWMLEPKPPEGTNYIAVTSGYDGEIELWCLENNTTALEELQRLYCNELDTDENSEQPLIEFYVFPLKSGFVLVSVK